MLFIGFVVPTIQSTEPKINDTEFEATFVGYEVSDGNYLVSVDEYNCKLFVKANAMVDKKALLNVVAGEKVYFRLIELSSNPLESPYITQVYVVSLRTATQDIITLNTYNDSAQQGNGNIQLICIVGAIGFGAVAVLNGVLIYKKSKAMKQKM